MALFYKIEREILQSDIEIRQRGVIHGDLRVPNILWNTELGRVMLIDFERSIVMKHRSQKRTSEALLDVSPNKRRLGIRGQRIKD